MNQFLAKTLFGTLLVATAITANADWPARFNGAANKNDIPGGAILDPSGNILVVGLTETATNGEDVQLIKYDRLGAVLWTKSYDGTDHMN
ncbi:MAG TPA: hypothetical protein VK968_20975, partial [Roseimicrobium sp.]|nr:hypothetical protein [Roseimicrobium sp.]